MTWTTYGATIASYLSFACAALCCWPGLIRRRDPALIMRIFWTLCVAEALILLTVLVADILLLTTMPDSIFLDHFRRIFSRWARAGLFASILITLCLAAVRPPIQRVSATIGIMLCAGLLVAMTHSPAKDAAPVNQSTQLCAPTLPAWGNPRSRIVHTCGCHNYPGLEGKPTWQRFATLAEAEQAGYRLARNCPAILPQLPRS